MEKSDYLFVNRNGELIFINYQGLKFFIKSIKLFETKNYFEIYFSLII